MNLITLLNEYLTIESTIMILTKKNPGIMKSGLDAIYSFMSYLFSKVIKFIMVLLNLTVSQNNFGNKIPLLHEVHSMPYQNGL